MFQTFLALAAVACFGYLALSHQKMDHQAATVSVAAEADLAAADVARALMTRVERSAFDEDDTGRVGVRSKPSDVPLGPDDGETGPALFDDVDDWTGYEAVTPVAVGEGALTFQTYVVVRYVDDKDIDKPKNKATLTKEITVIAIEAVETAAERRPARAMLKRVVTPAGQASTAPAVR